MRDPVGKVLAMCGVLVLALSITPTGGFIDPDAGWWGTQWTWIQRTLRQGPQATPVTKSAEKPRHSCRGGIGVGRAGLNAQEPNKTHAVPEPSMGEGTAEREAPAFMPGRTSPSFARRAWDPVGRQKYTARRGRTEAHGWPEHAWRGNTQDPQPPSGYWRRTRAWTCP